MRRAPQFLQLLQFRIRLFTREPGALFWTFVFPVLTSAALGLAFRNRDLAELNVAVIAGAPGAAELTKQLDAVDGLRASQATAAEAQELLRRGRVALVVSAGAAPELVVDPTQPDGRTARLLALDAMERARGRVDTLIAKQRQVTAPGSRYIDFLIPGLLGMSILSTGIWGIGWNLVQMRSGKLLKRMIATPMSRVQFLGSSIVVRSALAVVEVGFFVGFARLLFGVRVFGSYGALLAFGLFGALCCAGLGLLTASRAQNSETASGLMNLVTMPMMGLSGVFFAATNFPGWMQPAIKLLPLTALIDGLRAIMLDGASITALPLQLAVLGAWGAGSFALALRFFRWQ